MFVNETKNDVEFSLKASENLAGKKSRLLLLVVMLVILAVGGVTLALELTNPGENGADIALPVTCFVCGALLGVLLFVLKPIMRKAIKKASQGKEGLNRYTFTEEGYEIQTTLNDGTVSATAGNYGGLVEAKEYKEMWLLFLNKATVFVVAKAGMVEGTAEELTALFMRAMGNRYKTCYKR